MEEENEQRAPGHERFFDVLGWFGFLFLVPFILDSLGNHELLGLVLTYFGTSGGPLMLMTGFFCAQFLRTFFGSCRIVAPLMLGMVSSFLLLATVLPLHFMAWWRVLVLPSGLFTPRIFVYAIATIVILLAYALSRAQHLRLAVQLFVLFLFPVALLYAGHYFKIAAPLGLPG